MRSVGGAVRCHGKKRVCGILAPIKRAVLVGLAYSSGWMSSQNWAWVRSVGVKGQMQPSGGR